MAQQYLFLIGGRRYTSSEAEAFIVQALPEIGVGRTAHRIVNRYAPTDLDAHAVSRMLVRLSKAGKIARLSRGVYAPLAKD